MSGPEVEKISTHAFLGEGPHWDHDAETLYYVDIKGPTVHNYVPARNKHTAMKNDGVHILLVIPLEGTKDKFVITVGHNVAILTWDGESSTPTDVKYVSAVDNEKELQDNRLNDGKADPTGRLWAGSMGPKTDSITDYPPVESLFSFSKDWKSTKHVARIKISNGLAWNEHLN